MTITTQSGIYKITNKINGKVYIGKAGNLANRFRSHKWSRKSKDKGSLIIKAIKKYGWENFIFEIIESYEKLEDKFLLEREAHWIKKFDATNPKVGYNLLKFGTKGHKHSSEFKLRMSQLHRGKKNPNYGKVHSKSTRLLISKYSSKAVKQIDLKTNAVVKIWSSAKAAHDSLTSKINPSALIPNVCNQRKQRNGSTYETAYGYKWEWVNV